MQRYSEKEAFEPEFSGRYILDEARFPAGSEIVRNREEAHYEPTADFN